MKKSKLKLASLLMIITLCVNGTGMQIFAEELPTIEDAVEYETASLEDLNYDDALEDSAVKPIESVLYQVMDKDGVIQEYAENTALLEDNIVQTDALYAQGKKKLSTPTAEWAKEKGEIEYQGKEKDGTPFTGHAPVWPGTIIHTCPEDATNRYEIEIFKSDGTKVSSHVIDHGSFFCSKTTDCYFYENYHESGDYYFTIVSKGDGKTSEDSDPFRSEIWHFQTTGERLSTPEKPVANVLNRSFTISLPLTVDGVMIDAYFKKTMFDTPRKVGGIVYQSMKTYSEWKTDNGYRVEYTIPDYVLNSNGEGYYSIASTALSYDPEKVQSSEESEMSEVLFTGENTESVNRQLNDIIDKMPDNPTDQEKKDTINSIKEIGTTQLKESMAVDTNNSGTSGLIKDIEKDLGIPVGINVDHVDGMGIESANDIQLIGAGLNAKDFGSGVVFNLKKPLADVVVPGAYHSTIQVDFALDGTDYQGEKLNIPVKIVVPVPSSIDPNNLRILHYHNSTDTYSEIIFPHVYEENGKWYASFAVDTFSPFVFAESDGSDVPKNESILVVKQKMDVTSLFSKKYSRYGLSPSSTKGIVTISSKGVVLAKKAGTAKVAGLVKSGNKWVADTGNEVTIKVEKPVITNKTVTLTKAGELFEGSGNIIVGGGVKPSSWSTSKEKVALIDSVSGQITAKDNGSTKITAVFGTGNYAAKYTYTVKVRIPKLNKTKSSLQTGATLKLSVANTSLPVIWSSSNESVATIDKGKVTGLTAGTAIISATIDEIPYTAEITVLPPELKKSSLRVKAGGTVTVGLKKTKLKPVTWFSSDESVATVDDRGRVKGISKGKVEIYTTTGMPEGEKLSCEVEVY